MSGVRSPKEILTEASRGAAEFSANRLAITTT